MTYQPPPRQNEGHFGNDSDLESHVPILQHSQDTNPGIEERGKDIVWPVVAVETRRPWISQTTAGLLLFAFSTLMVTLM